MCSDASMDFTAGLMGDTYLYIRMHACGYGEPRVSLLVLSGE